MRAIINALKNFIRLPYAWPGGYQLVAIMRDGGILCVDCCEAEYKNILDSTKHGLEDGWDFYGVDVVWEGPNYNCAHCEKEMETEYGDPLADYADNE